MLESMLDIAPATRGLKVFELSRRALAEMFKTASHIHLTVTKGLPEDATVEQMEVDSVGLRLRLLVSSEAFPLNTEWMIPATSYIEVTTHLCCHQETGGM